MMETRIRFAPSPTGHVHIGNIRTAIFNWLYARHCNGKFLLRVEDTDRERSTSEAIKTLIECMNWLGIDYDEEIYYQSHHAGEHVKSAQTMIDKGLAYRPPQTGPEPMPIIFRIPWNTDNNPSVRKIGTVEIPLATGTQVKIGSSGISFTQLNEKGSPMERTACLAGFHGLNILDSTSKSIFELDREITGIFAGNSPTFDNVAKMVFERREVFFSDIIKGELAKPLDSMKDLVIVRGDGNPVFHLANVCDDIEQKITHIIRGDDHVENTYRHIFLFQALGFPIPQYGHLPMIVNQAGKPFCKRDGDAYVGDFKSKGYLPEALFNYLTLLGWSPGDDREKMSRKDIISSFTLERVKSSSAQFDFNKLNNMNAQYMAEMDPSIFTETAWETASSQGWISAIDKGDFAKIATFMQTRIKLFPQVNQLRYFFFDEYEIDEKSFKKLIEKKEVIESFKILKVSFANSAEFSVQTIEKLIREAEKQCGIPEGKLNQPLRIAITGQPTGAGIYETVDIIGKEKTLMRISTCLDKTKNLCPS